MTTPIESALADTAGPFDALPDHELIARLVLPIPMRSIEKLEAALRDAYGDDVAISGADRQLLAYRPTGPS